MKTLSPKEYDHLYKETRGYKAPYKQAPLYRVWQWIVKYTRQVKDPKILEIGCGSGQLAHFLHDEGFTDYAGFDFSKEAIKLAKEKSPQLFWVGDINESKNYDKDYNVVLATEVLEHLPNDYEILHKLKVGTKIIFSLPTFAYHNHFRHFPRPVDVTLHYINHINIKQLVMMPAYPYWHIGWGIVK